MDETRAACRNDPEAFYLAFSPLHADAQRMIHEYCDYCPIRLSCLSEALEHRYMGVYGGKTYKQRKELLAIMHMFD